MYRYCSQLRECPSLPAPRVDRRRAGSRRPRQLHRGGLPQPASRPGAPPLRRAPLPAPRLRAGVPRRRRRRHGALLRRARLRGGRLRPAARPGPALPGTHVRRRRVRRGAGAGEQPLPPARVPGGGLPREAARQLLPEARVPRGGLRGAGGARGPVRRPRRGRPRLLRHGGRAVHARPGAAGRVRARQVVARVPDGVNACRRRRGEQNR